MTSIATAQAQLDELRSRTLAAKSKIFSAMSISKDDLLTACWCLKAVETAVDESFMYDLEWPATRKVIVAHRGNLPKMAHKKIAKMIGDLMDDVTEWTDAREAAK